MVDIPVRMKQRGGVNPPSRVDLHIYKDPPKSVTTRRYEPVSEADVMWMTRPDGNASDPTRINEAISYYAKGINPSVEVEYQNHGAGGTRTLSIPQHQAGSPYRIEVVRPPLFPPETLLPLSRPRIHQNKAVESNPGLPFGQTAYNTLAYDMDYEVVKDATRRARAGAPQTVSTTATYKIEQPTIMSARYAINEAPAHAYVSANPGKATDLDQFVCREESAYGTIVRPLYSVTSNLKLQGEEARNDDASAKVKEQVLFQNVRPNFQIVVYDPSNHVSTEVSANIKEKMNIAASAAVGKPIILDRTDGTKIRLKDYKWTVVNTNAGLDQVILSVEDPNIQLERNLPLYAARSNPTLANMYNEDAFRSMQDEVSLPNKIAPGSFSNPANYIPTKERYALPQINSIKDSSMMKHANTASFERLFV